MKSILLFGCLFLGAMSCSVQLSQPPGPPRHSIQGLFLTGADKEMQVLRILCEDQTTCYFRYQKRNLINRLVSGQGVEVIERKGRVLTSAGEILLEQTFFSRYTLPCITEHEIEDEFDFSIASCGFRKLDREFYSSDSFMLFTVEEGRLIGQDGLIFTNECKSNCNEPIGIIKKTDTVSEGISLDFDLIQGLSDTSVSAAREGRFSMKPTDSKNKYIIYLEGKPLMQSYRSALVASHQGKTAADEERERKEQDKQNRRDEIRKRIEAGEDVSKEELLEILEK